MANPQEVIRTSFAEQDLIFTDDQLYTMTKYNPGVIECVPGFRYWALGEERKMIRGENICGHQQRAFEYYWAIRAGVERGSIVLGIGTAANQSPSEFLTDRFNGETPEKERTRYTEDNSYSSAALDAAKSWDMFYDQSFQAVILNHVFEHFDHSEQVHIITEAHRVLRSGGLFCSVMPDCSICGYDSIDPTHKKEYSADEFVDWVVKYCIEPGMFQIVEHNTFDNNFSFNTVLVKM